jgi:hypothetical protein
MGRHTVLRFLQWTGVIVHGPLSSPFAPRKQRHFRGAKGDYLDIIPPSQHWPINGCWIGCLGLLLLMVSFQAGCKRSTTIAEPKGERITEAKNAADVPFPYKGMNGEDILSSTGKNGVPLPSDFPADVPVYPKATPAMVARKDKETTVLFTTPDSLKKAVTFYKSHLKENGWKIRMIADSPQVSLLEGEKEARSLTLLLTENSEGTGIQLTLMKKK